MCLNPLVLPIILSFLFTVVEKKEHELEQLRMDCEHFKARLETAQADCMKERKVERVCILSQNL